MKQEVATLETRSKHTTTEGDKLVGVKRENVNAIIHTLVMNRGI